MKLVCSTRDLNANLSLIGRAVPSRPTHPVLGNVLFKTDADLQQVSLTAFDLTLGLQTSFPAEVSETGAFTIPAKLLNDIVSRLPEGELTLLCDFQEEEEGFTATLISASGRYRLRGLDAEEFQDLPEIEEGEELSFPVKALTEGLSATLFAASTDETKQVLTGVHLTQPEESLEFAATDGHRLATLRSLLVDEAGNAIGSTTDEDLSVTIPARALRELERMLKLCDEKDMVAVRFDETQISFEMKERRLTSRQLEGAYPPYQQLIPRQFSKRVTLERQRLLKSLELVSVFADRQNNIAKFSVDNENQQLTLSVDAQEVGSATESIPAQVTGESIDIAFNVKYLVDGLKALPASEIQMQLNGATQPVIFTPLGDVKMVYLVMPVQLRG